MCVYVCKVGKKEESEAIVLCSKLLSGSVWQQRYYEREDKVRVALWVETSVVPEMALLRHMSRILPPKKTTVFFVTAELGHIATQLCRRTGASRAQYRSTTAAASHIKLAFVQVLRQDERMVSRQRNLEWAAKTVSVVKNYTFKVL